MKYALIFGVVRNSTKRIVFCPFKYNHKGVVRFEWQLFKYAQKAQLA